ncbi:LysR family transcriptional regulator [Marinobacterium sp. YM272]|uniref:LysR family transcriptional regulator n=1 Tax=Marinobacterium sp. YM272 TaxID=3421654 RepID=UPI003D7F27DB
MTLQQLELILAIADSGSIHSACNVLGKTQPTLTKALKSLEEELGVPLFSRSSRGMTPTELGKRTIARARIICAETNTLKAEMAQLLGASKGQVAACASPLVAYAIMPSVIMDFRKQWPDIEINITEAVYPEALNRLREGFIDFNVGPSPEESSVEFNEEILFQSQLVAVAKSGSAFHKARRVEELADAPWVVMSSQKGPGKLYNDMFTFNGISAPKRVIWLNSLTMVLEVVKKSDCCCLFPEQLLHASPQEMGLKKIDLFQKSPSVPISLFTRHDSPLTPAAEALARLVRLHCTNFIR